MRKFVSRSALAAAALALGISGAHASNTATGTISVTASVASSCSVSDTTPVAFSTLSNDGSANDATGTISITCNGSGAYTVSLDKGTHGLSTTARNMVGVTPGNSVNYHLYRTAAERTAGTTEWDDTTNTLSQTQTGTPVNLTGNKTVNVYGRVKGVDNTGIAPDTYSDLVNITVNY